MSTLLRRGLPRNLTHKKILSHADLRAWGIPYSKSHLRRLWEAGKFPRPFQLNPGGPLCWLDTEIDAHIEARAAARDQGGA
jgi:predicted DNA-binding transcriptional regulator AlpA